MSFLKILNSNLIKSHKSEHYLFFKNIGVQISDHKWFKSSIKIQATGKPAKDEPIKYSTSKAKIYDPIDTFSNKSGRTKPKSEPFIIMLSTMTLFVYFTFLREENELDELLSRPLEDSVPNIKIMSLTIIIS